MEDKLLPHAACFCSAWATFACCKVRALIPETNTVYSTGGALTEQKCPLVYNVTV